MRRLLAIILMLGLVTSLFIGCSASTSTTQATTTVTTAPTNSATTGQTTAATAAATTTAAERKPRKFTLSHNFPESHVVGQGLIKANELLKQKTNNAYEFQIFHAGTYAKYNDAVQALVMGSLDAGQIDTAMEWEKSLGVILSPYLFRDYDHWNKFVQSDIYDEFRDAVSKAVGIKHLSMNQFGFRYVTSNKIYRTPEDFANVKLRMPVQAPYPEMATVLNCVGMPLDAGEVYMALQTKVVDGQENPYTDIVARKFYEVQKYIIRTAHVLSSSGFGMSKKTWDSLSAADKELMQEVFDYASLEVDKATVAKAAEFEKFLIDQGLEIIDVDKQPFIDRVPLVLNKYPEFKYFYDKIQAIK